MQHINDAEYTNIWWTTLSLTFIGSHRHCSTGRGDRLAVRSRSSGANTEGPATECASSSDVDWWSVNVADCGHVFSRRLQLSRKTQPGRRMDLSRCRNSDISIVTYRRHLLSKIILLSQIIVQRHLTPYHVAVNDGIPMNSTVSDLTCI